MAQLFEHFYIERYRPQTLDEIVLSERVKQEMLKCKAEKEIPHLLFVSGPGQGKTTLAKIIVKDLLDCTYLYINASDENGIDTVRAKVTEFARTKSIDGKIKVVILDEADFLSKEAQGALRNLMEEYASNTRFILTANYAYRIITPLQSRCQSYDINPPLEGVVSKVVDILKKEKIQVESGQKEKLLSLIRNNYPDVRKIINLVQKNITDGKLDIHTPAIGLDFAETIIDKTIKDKQDVTAIRRYIIENDSKYNKDYHGLLKDMFNVVDEKIELSDKKRKYLLVLTEHMYRHTFVMDPEINCYAAVIALQNI
jgi:DNA polymerase III delta prime subunit